MKLPPSFEALFDDIAQDWDYAIQNPITDPHGRIMWRDVAYATPAGFRPLMLDLILPKGVGPFPLVVFIHGGMAFRPPQCFKPNLSQARLCKQNGECWFCSVMHCLSLYQRRQISHAVA